MTNHSATQPTIDVSARKTKKGFTLTEIAIVLGIVGLILGAVWSAAKNVYSNVNSTKATEIMSILVAQVRGAYGNTSPTAGDLSGAFTSVTFPNLQGAGGTTVSGNAKVTAAVTGGSSPTGGFTIEFTQAAGSTFGPLFNTNSTGIATCQGVVQAVSGLPGTSAASTSAAAVSLAGPVQCTGGTATSAGTCPALTGATGSTCTGFSAAIPGGTCTYTQTAGATSACTGGTTGAVAVFVPWNPS